METRALRYFIVVAEELNLRKASDRLGIQKPPLSRAISNLEIDVGTNLFDRSDRRLRLTPAGSQLLRDARIILRLVDRAGAAARDANEDSSSAIRLGVVGSGSSRSIDRFLQALWTLVPSEKAPATELPTSLQVQLLLDGRLDACIVIPPIDEPRLIVQPLWRESLVILLPEHHTLADEPELSPQQLTKEKLILPHSDFGSGSHQQIVEALTVEARSSVSEIERDHGVAGAAPASNHSNARQPCEPLHIMMSVATSLATAGESPVIGIRRVLPPFWASFVISVAQQRAITLSAWATT